MTRLYLYDDARARTFEPFAVTRPVSELVAGTQLLRSRWERVSGVQATGFISAPHLADFEEFDASSAIGVESTNPREVVNAVNPAGAAGVLPEGALIVNSRCVVALDEVLVATDHVWSCDGIVCAVRLPRAVHVSELSSGMLSLETLAADTFGNRREPRRLHGRWLHEVWDCIAQLSAQLTDDILALQPYVHSPSLMYDSIGEHPLIIEDGAVIEPYVLFDTTSGPILIRSGATISAFTRVVGPCYVDHHATLLGDKIGNCSIGEWSKVRGEMHSSIIIGHSNKGHTGFVGHSYLGRWVNLGAGTTTSNLKNTYGTVQLWTPSGIRDTGLQFLGTLFGDHSKTGIGLMLTTGTVLGAGANIYGSSMPPKHVPPFAWGDGEPYGTYALDKFLVVAERVMQRRQVTFSEQQRRQFTTVYTERAVR